MASQMQHSKAGQVNKVKCFSVYYTKNYSTTNLNKGFKFAGGVQMLLCFSPEQSLNNQFNKSSNCFCEAVRAQLLPLKCFANTFFAFSFANSSLQYFSVILHIMVSKFQVCKTSNVSPIIFSSCKFRKSGFHCFGMLIKASFHLISQI